MYALGIAFLITYPRIVFEEISNRCVRFSEKTVIILNKVEWVLIGDFIELV